MMAPSDEDVQAAERRTRDDELLTELTAPLPVEQAREAYLFWQHRLNSLPIHKRSEREEAERMTARWKDRLAKAERHHYGPGLLEQLLSALGVRRMPSLPSRRRVMLGVSLLALVVMLLLIALVVAIVVFWPQIQPIVQTLLNGQGG